MISALYFIVALACFVLLGTVVPFLVSMTDTFAVLAGFSLGFVLLCLMVFSMYNLVIVFVKSFDRDAF